MLAAASDVIEEELRLYPKQEEKSPANETCRVGHSMEECNSYGTFWTMVGRNETCIEKGCEWIPGRYTGGSCVKGGECSTGDLNAEKDALGKANQATIMVCAV